MTSAAPWDACDDAPAEDLLAAAGWSAAAVGRCRALYDSLLSGSGAGPSRDAVTSLLAQLGLESEAPHACRALFRREELGFEHFVIGLAALDPNARALFAFATARYEEQWDEPFEGC